MVKNFTEWCEAVLKERLKLAVVEDYLSADGKDRLAAFIVLDDISEYAIDANDMLTWISNTKEDLSDYERDQLASPHLTQAINRLRKIAVDEGEYK